MHRSHTPRQFRSAVRAPSGHTQPWRFQITADRLHIRCRPQPGPARVDPEARAMVISCGAATLSYGWGSLWTWAPDLTILVADLALVLAAAASLRVIGLLQARRTT